MNGRSSRVIASSFAMAAFAVAVLSGLFSDNPAFSVLGRALASMIMCYPVGLVVGLLCDRVITAHVGAHKLNHPMPDAASLAQPDQAQAAAEEAIVV